MDTNANFKQGKQLKDDDDNKKPFVSLKQNNNDEVGIERLDLLCMLTPLFTPSVE